jgi:hypothetical protein
MVLTIAAFSFVLALMLAAFIDVANQARSERERLEADGETVQGEMMQVWPQGNAFGVCYRFVPKGGFWPVVRTDMAPYLQVLVPGPGETVKVRYDPRDPRRARMLPKA